MTKRTTDKASRLKHLFIATGCGLLIGIIISFLFYQQEQADTYLYDYSQIKERGVIRVIVEHNNMSYWPNADSSLTGLQYQMIQAFAKKEDLKIHFIQETNQNKAIRSLIRNEVDLLVWHIPVYKELKDLISYSIPVFTSRQVLIQREKTEDDSTLFIRNQLDLAKQTVVIQAGTIYKQRLINLAIEIGDSIFVEEIPNAKPADLFKMVAKGDIDYAVCDEFVARVEIKEFKTLDMKTAISFKQNYAWGINKESIELQDSINNWLSVYLESKTYNTVYRKYTGVD